MPPPRPSPTQASEPCRHKGLCPRGVRVLRPRILPSAAPRGVFVFDLADFRTAAARFAQNFSILFDIHILREQARVEVSPLEARLPHPSPRAVSLKAKLRIER